VYCPPPPGKPTLLQSYCATYAQYTPPPPPTPPPLCHTPLSVMAISCKGQGAPPKRIKATNRKPRESKLSVCVMCGSPVWPSPPVAGPLRGPSLCVGPLWTLWVGSSPVVFPFPVASVPRLASRLRSRSRSEATNRKPRTYTWPLQDIRSLQSVLALINPPFIAPSIYIAHASAIPWHD